MREERHAGLAGDGPRHQRLAGAGRPDEQHAARDARAERVELLRVLQELDDFLELGLRLVDAGHVGERHDGLVAEEHPGPALAEAEGLVIRALGLAHHEEDEAADDEDRQQAGEDDAEPRGVGRLLGLEGSAGRRRPRPAASVMSGQDLLARRPGTTTVYSGAVLRLDGQLRAFLDDGGTLAVLDVVEELRVGLVVRRGRLPDERDGDGERDDHKGQHHDAVAEELGVQRSLRGSGSLPRSDHRGEYSAGLMTGLCTAVRRRCDGYVDRIGHGSKGW